MDGAASGTLGAVAPAPILEQGASKPHQGDFLPLLGGFLTFGNVIHCYLGSGVADAAIFRMPLSMVVFGAGSAFYKAL
jgi:hypothetical protein